MKVGNLEDANGGFIPNPRTDHRSKSDESGNIRNREGNFRKGNNRSPRPVVPDAYVPVVQIAPETIEQESTDSVGQLPKVEAPAEVLAADAHSESVVAHSNDSGESPKKPEKEKDAWEYAEEAGEVRDRTSGEAKRNGSFFPEIAKVREEILKEATLGLTVSGDAFGSSVSPDMLQKLGGLRKDKLAERIQEIISDPTKNSKQILSELNNMKNDSLLTSESSAPGKTPDPDVSMIADALSVIDSAIGAARAEKDRRGAEKPKREQAPGKASLPDVQEYLSELVLEHYFSGMKDGRFDKGGVPHLSLDTLLWKDGRVLLEAISSRDRSAVAKLLKETERELGELNESEIARRMDIFNKIQFSFINTDDSIKKLERVDSLDDLEAMPFPFPMKKMKELGLDDLPERMQTVLMKKRKHALERWKEAKDAARKRLKVAMPKKTRKQKEKIDEGPVVIAEASLEPSTEEVSPVEPDSNIISEAQPDADVPVPVGDALAEAVVAAVMTEGVPAVPETSENSAEKPDFEALKNSIIKGVEERMAGISVRIKEAEASKNRMELSAIRRESWIVKRSLPDTLGVDERKEIEKMLRDMNLENGRVVKHEVNATFRRMILMEEKTSGFYADLEHISDLGEIDGVESDGNAWASRIRKIGTSALRMNEEEFDRRDWEQPVPEFLRDAFFKILKKRRELERVDPVVAPQEPKIAAEFVSKEKELSLVADLRDAQTFDQFYFVVRQMEGLHEDGRPDNVLSGDGWEKLLHTMESNARRMDDEEYLSGHWRAGIPEVLRSKFIELLDADRDYGKNPVGGAGRVMNEVAEKPVEDAVHADDESDVIHARRAKETDASVKLAESMEKQGKIMALKEKIASLKAVIPEKELYQVDLETKRNTQREESIRLSVLRAEYEKRFRNIFLKAFTNEDRLGQFNREEGWAKKKLEDMDAEWRQKKEELSGLHVELHRAIDDLEELTKETELSDTFARESVAKAFGPPLEGIGEVVHGDNGDDPEEDSDRHIEAIADGTVAAEKIGSDKGKESPKERGKIYPGVPELFKGEFGIFEDDLKKVEGFDQLSWGQQRLVFENLRQLTLGRVQEEAIDFADKDAKEDKWVNGTNWIRKGWKAASRKYQIAKVEKKTGEEIVHGGLAVHGEILKQLVQGAQSGPEVVYDPRTSELDIHFASGRQFADVPERERGALDAFNAAADEFSAIPAQWRYKDSAKGKDHKKYEEGEEKYEDARDRLLNFLIGRYGEEEARWTINDLEAKVRMTQFLRTTKDAERQFLSIRNDAALTRIWKDTVTERGVMFGLGFGVRTVAAAGAGFIAAPILPAVLAGAGLVGGVTAYLRSKEQLREKERRSRKGRGEEKDPTLTKFPSTELSAELSKLADTSLNSFGEKDQEEKVLQLRKSLDVIRKKMESGMVDFGTETEAPGNEYTLLSALSRASAVVAMYSADESGEFQTRLNEAVESNMEFIEGETARAKKKRMLFVGKNILTGVALSATSGGLGYGANYVAEHGSSILPSISDSSMISDGPEEALGKPRSFFESTAKPTEATPAEQASAPDDSGTVGEPRQFFKSTAEPTTSPAEVAPVPKPSAPIWSPLLEEDWNTSSRDSGFVSASYQAQESPVSDEENPLSEWKKTVPSRPAESAPVGSGTGVEANNLHGRMEPDMSPEQQVAILNADQPVADQAELSQETRDEIARQDAEALAELQEPSPTSDGEVVSSDAVSQAWNESVEKVQLGTENDFPKLGNDIPREISLDSRDAGVGVSNDAVAGVMEEGNVEAKAETVSTASETELSPLSVAEKADVDLGITHEAEQIRTGPEVNREYLNERVGAESGDMEVSAVQSSGPGVSEAEIKMVYSLVESDEVREYLMTHPENIETFKRSLADYDASIFESAHGDIGMRGVVNMSELNDDVEAKQVMYDCLKLIRDPLTPTYEVKTYQLANSLNFDQMQNVGEFMMKASERFGRGAFPIENESLRRYLERMTALFAEQGETVKLNGDTRLLKQLAFRNFKR